MKTLHDTQLNEQSRFQCNIDWPQLSCIRITVDSLFWRETHVLVFKNKLTKTNKASKQRFLSSAAQG